MYFEKAVFQKKNVFIYILSLGWNTWGFSKKIFPMFFWVKMFFDPVFQPLFYHQQFLFFKADLHLVKNHFKKILYFL